MIQQKVVGENDLNTELKRCLSTPHLILLGVGNTIGVGIYVMLGVMAKEKAGPSVIFCFTAAIFVTLMNALVYAEFATYVPQTGAAYIYIYKVFGEFAAFLCGWLTLITYPDFTHEFLFIFCQISAYTFSSSVGARAWSGMLDSFFNNSIQVQTDHIFGKIQFGMPFADSLDVLAFAFQIVVAVIISCNVLCSSVINTILGILTSSVLIFVFIAGFIYGNPDNFKNADHGGFFPFGIAGVIKGTSLALYATSGYDIICLSAEETKNPARAIPRAIILELLIVGTVYVGAAVGMLFLIPYWLIDLRSPLPSAFEYSQLPWGKLVVTIGPIFGITNLQMLGIYGVSRLMYRMAKDGLFLECFLKVNKRTGVPLNSVICIGIVTSLSALMFDLSYIIKISVLLMIMSNIFVGSALIKLITTEAGKKNGPLEEISDLKTTKTEEDFIEQEVIVSELKTCEGADLAAEDTSRTLTDSQSVSEYVTSNNSHAEGSVHILDRSVRDVETSEYSALTNEIDKSSDESRRDGTSVTNTVYEETEDDLLFQKSPNVNHVQLTETYCTSGGDHELGFKSRVAACLSPFLPGILSVNVILALHWISCLAIAMQINFGWHDIIHWRSAGMASIILLLVLLLFLSFLLWSQCRRTNKIGFQTPLMPFIPTLSVLSSSVLLFSAGDLSGFVEVIILAFIGAIFYIGMVLCKANSDHSLLMSSRRQERNSLLSGSGDDADDEIESDEI
ncbi:Cationic amino acid transporter 4 [Bulinus truncatus]|nr:Cationic amino acid transporter 4 [Bulinus truncatus]